MEVNMEIGITSTYFHIDQYESIYDNLKVCLVSYYVI